MRKAFLSIGVAVVAACEPYVEEDVSGVRRDPKLLRGRKRLHSRRVRCDRRMRARCAKGRHCWKEYDRASLTCFEEVCVRPG
jgi:hypothetical protein